MWLGAGVEKLGGVEMPVVGSLLLSVSWRPEGECRCSRVGPL